MNFKLLAIGSLGEMCSNLNDVLEISADNGTELIGRIMAATKVEVVNGVFSRRLRSQVSLAAWRKYVNLLLDKMKNIGIVVTGTMGRRSFNR